MKSAIALVNIAHETNQVSLVRTADHFGIRRIFIVGKEPTGWKSCMNCHRNMLIKRFPDIPEFLQYVKDHNYDLCIAEQTNHSQKIHNAIFPKNPVFITGNERQGVPQELLQSTPYVYEIPNTGMVQCMNTAVAGGILIYKWFEQAVLK